MRAALLLVPLAGCGIGFADDDSGGRDNLPTLGAGPYGRPSDDLDTPAEEPFVVSSRTASYSDPGCLWRDDGGLRVWFTTEDGIGYAEVAGLGELPDLGPVPALAADEPWEAGRIAEPTVIAHGAALVMLYEAGDPGAPVIGRADSTDDGASWTKRGMVATGGAPAVAIVDGAWHLFAEEGGAIVRRTGDGESFGDPEVIVTPRPELAGPDGAFDAASVGDPYVLVQTSDAGRRHWGLWFTGRPFGDPEPDGGIPEADPAIGFAGSFDGAVFERFGGVEPVLTAPAAAPCALLDGPRGVLLYHETQRQRLGIAAAVHP